ncbi:hypothetical protein KQX54_005587 [Cotesia glomerata]|uniref:Uncharacterized protein n=1 Tax=Cotesia glomerata TaxID=32391 RepID=A0AAV7J6B3_COTGL|nr:hypothetical protein KQX54_005587 [Cotesia glomerata]
MYIVRCSIEKYTTVYQNPEHELCREELLTRSAKHARQFSKRVSRAVCRFARPRRTGKAPRFSMPITYHRKSQQYYYYGRAWSIESPFYTLHSHDVQMSKMGITSASIHGSVCPETRSSYL